MISIELFLKRYQRLNTRIGYEVSLKDFFSYLQTTPEQYHRSCRAEYECDITGFITYLEDKEVVSKNGTKRKLANKSIEAKVG